MFTVDLFNELKPYLAGQKVLDVSTAAEAHSASANRIVEYPAYFKTRLETVAVRVKMQGARRD